jgi:predicted transposase YbfD/YdcC
VRVAVTPEEIGLCGCRQVIAVRRERQELDPRAKPGSDAIAYYATSIAADEQDDDKLLAAIRDHWSAIENDVHHRRDVSFGEDACRVANRPAAHALATLRNLAIGLFEIQSARNRVDTNGLKSWCRRMVYPAPACQTTRRAVTPNGDSLPIRQPRLLPRPADQMTLGMDVCRGITASTAPLCSVLLNASFAVHRVIARPFRDAAAIHAAILFHASGG